MRVPEPRDHLALCGIAPRDDPAVVAVDAVLGRVPRDQDLARLPAPLPPSEPFPEGRLSPRMLTLLARALDGGGTDRVLLLGEPLIALAAVLLALPDAPREVVVATHTPSRAQWTSRRLGLDDGDGPTIVATTDVPRLHFDRILAYGVEPDRYKPRLRPDGVLLSAEWHSARATLTSHVRFDGAGADIELTKHWVGNRDPPEPKPRRAHRTPAGTTVGRLLLLERMQDNAWRGIAATPTEQSVLRAVRETFLGGDPGTMQHELPDAPDLRLARRLFHLAYLEQVAGTRGAAEALYRASLSMAETAEAWTFYGWVRSQSGALQEAMDSCRRAIELDAGFGNPYNDIGAYLMAEGKVQEAKTWFERATLAPRYAAPHYPYTNLGRVYLREGDLNAAREAVQNALEAMPGYPPAERLLREIETREENDPSIR